MPYIFDQKNFETWFLSNVQLITQSLHILEGTGEMLMGKEREPLRAATDLAFRTMAESYLDCDSLSSGRWWLSQIYTEALRWTGEEYVYAPGSSSTLEFRAAGSPLSLLMEIYQVFRAGWPFIVNEALKIYKNKDMQSDTRYVDAFKGKLRYLLRNSYEDINRNALMFLSSYTRNLDIYVIDAISCEKYEGGSTKCQLAIISDEIGLTPFEEKSRIPFVMENVRALRKQAEMGRDDMCLAISWDGQNMLTRGLIPLKKAFCPIISIDQPMRWRFSLPSDSLQPMSGSKREFSVQFCRNTRSSFSFPPLTEELERTFFQKLCQETFRAQTDAELRTLLSVVSHLRQNAHKFHGTSILITANADAEAKRLCDMKHRGYRLATGAVAGTADLIPYLTHLSSIDGALVLAPDGSCAGFATILDGKAMSQGNPARGARYNSAQTYLDNVRGPALAIVISTDGSVDYLKKNRRKFLRKNLS